MKIRLFIKGATRRVGDALLLWFVGFGFRYAISTLLPGREHK